jgi:nucleotide-binding universal stress UspA family protein
MGAHADVAGGGRRHDRLGMEGLEIRLIVVGIDGSPAAADALEWAVAEARLTGAAVEAVYAWDPSPVVRAGAPPADWRPLRRGAEEHAAEIVHRVVGDAEDVWVIPRMVMGRAAEILVDESARADLLVVGSRGVGGLEGIELGSVSHHCAAYAECPVVVVRHDPLARRHAARAGASAVS